MKGFKCPKDEEDKVLMKDEKVQDCWKRYFCSLLNLIYDSNGKDLNDERDPFLYCKKIKTKDVKDIFGKMKNKKVFHPNSILIDVWKCIDNFGLIWLGKFFN